MPDSFPPSEGRELRRALDALTQTIKELRHEMVATYVRQDVYEAEKGKFEREHADMQDDIDSLNGFKEWAVRLVIGSVILFVLGFAYMQGGGQ